MESWGKMSESENPELTSSHSHTKTMTIYKGSIDEKDQNLAEKIHRDKKEATTRWAGGLAL